MTRRKRAHPDGAERPAERPDDERAEALRLKALEALRAEAPSEPSEHPDCCTESGFTCNRSVPESSLAGRRPPETPTGSNRAHRPPAAAALPSRLPSRAKTRPTDTTTQPNIAASTTSAAPSPSHPPTPPAATPPSVASTATPSPKAPSPGAALGLRLAGDLSREQWAVGAACARSTAYVEERSGDAKRDGSEYLSPAFLAAVHLKVERWLAGYSPLQAADVVERILTELYPDAEDPWLAALPDCDTFENPVDPVVSFISAWNKVTEPHPLDAWDLARWAAERCPLSSRLLTGRRKVGATIASIAYWLQRATPGEPFFISNEQIGQFVKTSHQAAGAYLNALTSAGALELVEKGSKVKRLASVYRWLAPVEVPVEVAVKPAESRRAVRRKRRSPHGTARRRKP